MHAVTWAGGTTRGDSPLHTATLLQSEVDGNFGFLNTWHARWNDDGTRDASGGKNVRKYFEANIAGSFDVEDIEEIRIAASNLEALGKAADPEGMTDEALNASIANPERLRSMGFSDEQIAYIMDQYNSGGYGFTNWFNEYKTYLRRKRGQEAIDSMGTKVTIIGDVAGGRDPLDINSYGGNEGFSTIEELLASRVRQNVQAVMEAAARAASGDVYEEDEDVA
jgi:hypothetical protein